MKNTKSKCAYAMNMIVAKGIDDFRVESNFCELDLIGSFIDTMQKYHQDGYEKMLSVRGRLYQVSIKEVK